MRYQRSVLDAGPGKLDADELVGIARLARLREHRSPRESGRDGREDVAAVERRRNRLQPKLRVRDVDRLYHATRVLCGKRQQPVVRPDQDPAVGEPQRDRAPLGADVRVDHREVHAGRQERERPAQHQRAGLDVVARDAVREIDNAAIWA